MKLEIAKNEWVDFEKRMRRASPLKLVGRARISRGDGFRQGC